MSLLRICVEGTNGSGKSTLTSYLSEYYDLKVYHPGPKPATNEIAVQQCMEQCHRSSCIYDRLTCITRQIYGDTKENVNGLGRRHMAMMDLFVKIMIKSNVIFIFTTGEGAHQLKDYYTPFHIEQITKNRNVLRSRYTALFRIIPHFAFDFKTQDMSEVIDYVETCRAKPRFVPNPLQRCSRWSEVFSSRIGD